MPPPQDAALRGWGCGGVPLQSHHLSVHQLLLFRKKKMPVIPSGASKAERRSVLVFAGSASASRASTNQKPGAFQFGWRTPATVSTAEERGSIHQAGPTLTSCLKVCSAAVYGEIIKKKKKANAADAGDFPIWPRNKQPLPDSLKLEMK